MSKSSLESNQQEDNNQHSPVVYQLTPREIIYLLKQDPRVYSIIASACKEVLLECGNNISYFCDEMRMPRQSAYNLFYRCRFKPSKYRHKRTKKR